MSNLIEALLRADMVRPIDGLPARVAEVVGGKVTTKRRAMATARERRW